MQLKQLGSNMTKLVSGNDEYFFSYETCVAGFTAGEGYWKTSEHFSSTTTKHINKYLNGVAPKMIVDQESIEQALVAFDA